MAATSFRCDQSWSKYAEEYNPIEVGSIDRTDTVPHDHAIIRALEAEYVPNKKVKGDPRHTIFVARLNPKTTQETISDEFSKFGKIIRCRLVRDIVTGKSKRYAFIEYESSSSTRKAIHNMDREYIDNACVLVDRELERVLKGWIPRRLGGGFGGTVNSGQLRFGCKDRPFNKPIVLDKYADKKRGYSASQHDNSNSRRSHSNRSAEQSKICDKKNEQNNYVFK